MKKILKDVKYNRGNEKFSDSLKNEFEETFYKVKKEKKSWDMRGEEKI